MTASSFPYTTPDRLVQDFATRGLIVLAPDSLGIAADVHTRVFAQEKAVHDSGVRVTPENVPAVLELLAAPGLIDACDKLVGERWAIVPFTHNASFVSGPRDQHWHADDNGPYNSRKQRHHQAVQIEMLYYPQFVSEQMGPTATVPYSQYWTFNHEENHDNFAGADHLDFDYMLSGMERQPISGPDSAYDVEDILHGRTAHDVRMREAVTKTGWPLVQSFAAAPLDAGSVVLYSHNTFHRGNHRRDDWQTWQDNPRFMWRFWLYRVSDMPAQSGETATTISWQNLGVDPMTEADLSGVSEDLSAMWRYHHHWIETTQPPPAASESATIAESDREELAEELADKLCAKYDEAEPQRVGAAYRLAALGDSELAVLHLATGLYHHRESARRAATYGLIAVGEDATETLLIAAESPMKWVRKNAVYALGDASHLTEEVLGVVSTRLDADPSVYIRSVAAGSLGCLGRRAIASGVGKELVPACVHALLNSLAHEENRLAMSAAQGRSIKFVRPTDDCDVCEGDGVDFGLERFTPVRSAVRENALWSMVMLCSHGFAVLGDAVEPTVTMLKEIVAQEQNVICVGYAMDALVRLAKMQPTKMQTTKMQPAGEDAPQVVADLRAELPQILASSPVQCWEALVRSGMVPEKVLPTPS